MGARDVCAGKQWSLQDFLVNGANRFPVLDSQSPVG